MEIDTILVGVYSYTYQKTAVANTTDSYKRQPIYHTIPIQMKKNVPLTSVVGSKELEKDKILKEKIDINCHKFATNV